MEGKRLICGCNNVWLADLEKAIAEGAKDFAQVQSATHLGYSCGNCVGFAREIVEELLAKNK